MYAASGTARERDDGMVGSFEEFYRREFGRAATIACAVSGSRVHAEDIAQDALLSARDHWETIRHYDDPGAWLRRVTIQLAGKRVRRARTEARALLKLGPPAPPPLPPGGERLERVLDAIGRLPRRQRAAVVLLYLEDRPVREVARILGCAEGTAKAHLSKARASLVRMLTEEAGR